MVVVGRGVDSGMLLVRFPVGVMKALNVMSVGIDMLTDIVLLVPLRSEPVEIAPVGNDEACEPVAEWEGVVEGERVVPDAPLEVVLVRVVVPFGSEGSVVVNDGWHRKRETSCCPRARDTQATYRTSRGSGTFSSGRGGTPSV